MSVHSILLLPRPLLFLLFLLFIFVPLLAQMPLRHTFDTREMCNARCNGQCSSENSSDHPGLPRWVCIMNGHGGHPKNTRYVDEEDPYYQDDSEGSSLPSLAILIPLCILATLVLFFVCVSCTQRFLR